MSKKLFIVVSFQIKKFLCGKTAAALSFLYINTYKILVCYIREILKYRFAIACKGGNFEYFSGFAWPGFDWLILRKVMDTKIIAAVILVCAYALFVILLKRRTQTATGAACSEIIGKTRRDGKIFYYINDGIYHTYSWIVFDHRIPNFQAFNRGRKRFVPLSGRPAIASAKSHLRRTCLPIWTSATIFIWKISWHTASHPRRNWTASTGQRFCTFSSSDFRTDEPLVNFRHPKRNWSCKNDNQKFLKC